MRPLQLGDPIYDFQDKIWSTEGMIVKKLPYRSYVVKLRNGRNLRRNRKHLKRAFKEHLQPFEDTDELHLQRISLHQGNNQTNQLQVSKESTQKLPNHQLQPEEAELWNRQSISRIISSKNITCVNFSHNQKNFGQNYLLFCLWTWSWNFSKETHELWTWTLYSHSLVWNSL